MTIEENIRYIKVFTPYYEYYSHGYFIYDVNKLGELSFGTVVETSMGRGIIIDENVPYEKTPTKIAYFSEIGQVASEKVSKAIKKQWWGIILEIHEDMKIKQFIINILGSLIVFISIFPLIRGVPALFYPLHP